MRLVVARLIGIPAFVFPSFFIGFKFLKFFVRSSYCSIKLDVGLRCFYRFDRS